MQRKSQMFLDKAKEGYILMNNNDNFIQLIKKKL